MADLSELDCWERTQARQRVGNVIDVNAYSQSKRLAYDQVPSAA